MTKNWNIGFIVAWTLLMLVDIVLFATSDALWEFLLYAGLIAMCVYYIREHYREYRA